MKSFTTIFFWMMIALMISCGYPKRKSSEGQEVIVENVKISNYGKALFDLDPLASGLGLDSLSRQFGFFIGEQPDSLYVQQIRSFITDPFIRELAMASNEKYPDLSFLEDGLTRAFSRLKYHFHHFEPPEVYTYVSGLLYEYPVHYADSVLIIALDMFLGRDFEPYRAVGIPIYMARRMERDNILPACSREIIAAFIPDHAPQRTFLDRMIHYGKVYYALDVIHPDMHDSLKIGYTRAQIKWCNDNELYIWRLFIDNELLYQTDSKLVSRFLLDGPFTSGLPDGAPAMLGHWIGWQIVKSYMKKNDIGLKELLDQDDSQKILTQSGYKPKK